MKKWLIAIVIVAILGFVGYKLGMNYVSNKVMDKIQTQILSPQDMEEMKKDPEVQQIIKQNFSDEEVKKLLPDLSAASPSASGQPDEPSASDTPADTGKAGSDGSAASPTPSSSAGSGSTSSSQEVLTRKQAEDLVMSKFSLGELKSMADMAKDGLTSEEKETIKSKLKAKLTDEQYQQLKVTALIEMMKQNGSNP